MQLVPTRDTCSVARKLRLELPWEAVEKDGLLVEKRRFISITRQGYK